MSRTASDVTSEVVDRLEPVTDAARDAAQEFGRAAKRESARARGAAERAAAQARARAVEVSGEAREAADPMLKKTATLVGSTAGTVVKAGRDASSGIIELVAKLLAIIAGVVGTAAERAGSEEIVVATPTRKRRGLRRGALLAGGGFALGAAAGYTYASRQHTVDDLWSAGDPDNYGAEAVLIEGERSKASMN